MVSGELIAEGGLPWLSHAGRECVDGYLRFKRRKTLVTAASPTTAAAIANPTSRPLTFRAALGDVTGLGAGLGAAGAATVALAGRGAGPDVGGRGGAGAAAEAGVETRATGRPAAMGCGAGGAVDDDGAGAAGVGVRAPVGSVGNLIVAVAEGFGGKLIRTVSFFACGF